MNRLIQVTQERRELALAKGLALAISDLIVTREYGQLESDLQQIMGNDSVRSVLVSDLKGNILAFLERAIPEGEVRSNFSLNRIDLPQMQLDSHSISQEGNFSVLWYKVDPGIPLGWIRLQSFNNQSDALLNRLRINVMLSVFVLFIGLFGFAVALFYRAKQKTEEQERQLINKNETLYDVAHYDSLTKLPNRLLLKHLIETAMAVSNRDADLLAICFLDLDGFKGVNDQMGHLSGDNLLIACAERMRKAIRDSDSVIRIGGDEFVLLLGGLKNKRELNVLIRRILDSLAMPFMIEGRRVTITASMGVVLYPMDNVTIEDLLSRADTAMYKAKEKGKNTWMLYEEGA
ncbi:MAG: GGDEF domain-containing protein [Polynucleobacter sp.]|nr:GGDEF domain-containing protein [Polynucleobacter sp.]